MATKENGLETERRQKALLVGVYTEPSERELCEEHLTELELLADTFHVDTIDRVACRVRKYDAALLLGKGKVEELVLRAEEDGADIVIIDHEVTPAQQRNLEERFKKTVLERREIILGVFGQRAQTKEAQLQVELAQVKYQAPRLKRLWTHLSRQAGTGGGVGKYLKGEGEKQIEIDRRLLQKRIDQLEKELKEVRAHRDTQRSARLRAQIPVFALVGYTNAGKSTLLNAMTDATTFVEDKLFATLDTTTRQLALSNNQKVLLIDTVGFIRKLPHSLVAAFRSTLEEAIQADILLHLVDASHPAALEQAEVTMEVLKELGAGKTPVLTVLNKADKKEAQKMLMRLRLTYSRTVPVSALEGTGLEELKTLMLDELRRSRQIVTLRIPQRDYGVVSRLMESSHILQKEYEENDVVMRAEVPSQDLGKLEAYIVEQSDI